MRTCASGFESGVACVIAGGFVVALAISEATVALRPVARITAPEMIGYAVRWGGTDREGDRTGFGRYGYGMPSSLVSLGKRYTVYSKANGTKWHAVTVDIDELADAAGQPAMPVTAEPRARTNSVKAV